MLLRITDAAAYVAVHSRTVRSWIDKGLVPGYVDPDSPGRIQDTLVDTDELDAALLANPRMKDGRKPGWSASARLVPLAPHSRRPLENEVGR